MRVSLKSFALCLIIAETFAVSAQTQEKKLIASPNIIPPATEAMQLPEFWISRLKGDPDMVIMTPRQITALNTKNRTRPNDRKNIHGDVVTFKNSSDYSYGWVPADHVAEGPVKKIRSLSEPDNFIVAINH